jgi:hypothetical protein
MLTRGPPLGCGETFPAQAVVVRVPEQAQIFRTAF